LAVQGHPMSLILVRIESAYAWARYSTLFHHNFGVFPLDQIALVVVRPSRNLKLISREIIFEIFQPVWKKHTWTSTPRPQIDGQTDGRLTTDTQTDDIGLLRSISGGTNAVVAPDSVGWRETKR